MQFKTIFVFALPVLAVPAPVAHNQAADLVTRGDSAAVAEVEHLEKREVITGIVTAVAISVGTAIVEKAANGAVQLIKDISSFNSARESFTKATTQDMFAKNPDPKKFAAAICNNVGSDIKNPNGITGRCRVELKQGLLNVDFDCFYLEAGNSMKSTGDGGFANIAIQSDSRCKFSNAGGRPSLTC